MVDDLVEEIIRKPELKGISVDFAKKILCEYLDENKKIKDEYIKDSHNFKKKKMYGELKSKVRARLRKVYGLFFTDKYPSKKKKTINKLLEDPYDNDKIISVLKLHRSSLERISSYPFFYNQIFSMTKKPSSIIDLGCGFNPYSYSYMGVKPLCYCIDIAMQDLEIISKYLKSIGLVNKTITSDLSIKKSWDGLPEADVAFALKLFDSLEEENKGITEYALSRIRADHIVVSFPTQSISHNKKIRKRNWFDKLVQDSKTTKIIIPGEEITIIHKKDKKTVRYL